ncbi:hypothetical protein K144316041_p20760 (plasmid) [Clostridium tetani]|nr:hypothetical protein K144316041_p20760 [Clostridium tetani]
MKFYYENIMGDYGTFEENDIVKQSKINNIK